MHTPLMALLRACSKEQRNLLATYAGTSVNYLYGLAGCHRAQPRASLALAIAEASEQLHDETLGITPIVTVRQLATMCVVNEF